MPSFANQQQRKTAEKLADKKAVDMPLRMNLNGSIADLSMLQRSVFFAEVAMICYLGPAECKTAAKKLGFNDCKYFDCENSRAYLFSNDNDSVVVCRGIEPTEWSVIKTEAAAATELAETVGKVQRNFKRQADGLWPNLEAALQENETPLWFAGHSFGGGLASICAGRCLLSYIKSEPTELYTFGSPRVGNDTYVNQAKLPHYRWVHNNDIVTHLPPAWFGYRHAGEEMYIDRLGQLKTLQDGQRIVDRLREFAIRLVHFGHRELTDHSITEYVEAIYAIQRRLEPNVQLPTAKAKSAAAMDLKLSQEKNPIPARQPIG